MNRERKLLFDLASDLRLKYKYMPVYINRGDDLFDITITLKKELIFIIWPRNEFILTLSDMKISLKEALEFYEKELIVALDNEKFFPDEGEDYIDAWQWLLSC